MTEAEHADLSRRLALAIGWPEERLARTGHVLFILTAQGKRWRRFDYRYPAVIWRVAERYDCFPWKNGGTHWCAGRMRLYYGDTAAEAVARAVIGAQQC